MEEEIKKDDVQVNKEISKEELKPTNKKKIIFNVYRCSSVLTVNSAYFLKEFYDHVHV